MATNKLTQKQCEEAKVTPGDKMTRFTDGEGLCLLVMHDGKKYWRFFYYYKGGRKTRGFGTYPKVSLSEARKLRREARELLAQGIDPVQADRDERETEKKQKQQETVNAGTTLKQIAFRSLEAKKGRVTEETRMRVFRQLDIHVFEKIGHKDISDITSSELLALFRDVANQDGHKRKKTYLARKLCQWLGEVYKFANFENPEFDRNPCASIIRHLPTHEEKHMRRIARDRLGEFLIALNNYSGYKETKAAMWMMLLTGTRQISVRLAQWRDFDLKTGTWHRQPEKQDKEPLDLPLPKHAVAILKCLKRGKVVMPDDLAFPTPRHKHIPLSEGAICKAIEHMKFDDCMVGHGLRGIVTTELNELMFPSRMVETQVGHKLESKVEAAYNQAKLFDQRRLMMEFFAEYLNELRKGKTLLEAKTNALKRRPEAEKLMTG